MIKFVIHGHRHWDRVNGNSYHLTTVTSTQSGRSIDLYDQCASNAAGILRNLGYDWREILTTEPASIDWRDYKNLANAKNRRHASDITPANWRGLTRKESKPRVKFAA